MLVIIKKIEIDLESINITAEQCHILSDRNAMHKGEGEIVNFYYQ